MPRFSRVVMAALTDGSKPDCLGCDLKAEGLGDSTGFEVAENENLPSYITIYPPSAHSGAQNYGSAFLPAAYQGTKFQISDSSQRNRAIDI
jgi:hypothetical protein